MGVIIIMVLRYEMSTVGLRGKSQVATYEYIIYIYMCVCVYVYIYIYI
jgi:hypothetical protein